ncbi:MAG: SprT family zinc-dependent metalloprotease [Bacteroidota bacterium]
MNKRENIVNYREIGNVRYVYNRRAKNLSLRINQQGEIRVTIPRYVSQKRAEAFLMSKKQWIMVKLSEINHWIDSGPVLREGDLLNIRGKDLPMVLQRGDNSVEDVIWRILLEEGKAYLPGRVKELALTHEFEVTGVKVRKMKSRWGSCSVKNSINLNSWLMMLPDHLMDYVILHELTHTRYRDHSKKFWEALDQVTGGSSKMLRKELRAQRIMLINPEN